MEGRQLKLLAGLALVLLGLISLLVFVEPPAEDTEDEDLEQLVSIASSELTRVVLSTDEGELVAEKTAEGWLLKSPLPARGDDVALDELAGLLDRMRFGEELPGAAATYGLDTPRAILTLERASGPVVLTLGSKAPVGYKAYVSLDGGAPRVVSGDPGDTLARGFATFRDATVHSFPESAVLAIAWAGEHSVAVRRNDAGWWLDDGRRARTERVEVWLQRLGELRLDSFWDELDPEAVGLTPPRGTLTLETSAGRDQVLLGGPHTGGVLVQTPTGVIGTLPDASDLERTIGELLDDRLLPIDVLGTDVLEVQLGAATTSLERSHTGWSSELGPQDETRVAELLAASTVDRAVQPERSESTGRVVARTADDEVVVVLGTPVPGGRVAWEEAGGPPFLVPDEVVERLEALLAGDWTVPDAG